jgi:arylsulfatase A-like enzyme
MTREKSKDTSGRPNVLFLFSDQHNARRLSCVGDQEAATPNLDRLACDGVRFDNAYCNNPICTPSRMSFLSSLYPSTHGYYGLGGPSPRHAITSVFSWFRERGYRTGALGKLHTPGDWVQSTCDTVYDQDIEHPKAMGALGLADSNDNSGDARVSGRSSLPYEHSLEGMLAGAAVRFIDGESDTNDERPWLAWVSFHRPHQPYTPSAPFASRVTSESVKLPPVGETETPKIVERREKLGEETLRRELSSYLNLIAQVDHGIGTIIDALEERGLLDDTVVIYSSDHGDFAGEHGLMEKRDGISYRAVTRVPMIVRYPRSVARGKVSGAVVESVDVFPTLCTLAGLPIPAMTQGCDLSGLLKGAGDDAVDAVKSYALTENCYRKALTDGRYRYVANLEDERDELYDIAEDPWELTNVIDEPSYANVAADMRRQLLYRLVKARRPITGFAGSWSPCFKADEDGRIDVRALGGSPGGIYD